MTEKVITKENEDGKPKKKYYKPRKKREIIEVDINEVKDIIKLYNQTDGIKIPKKIGKYCIGAGDGFCIHFEKKPNWLHRKCMKLFLGWKWNDYNN